MAFGHLQASPTAIPVVGVPSASAVSTDRERMARYHLYRLTPRASGWALILDVRGYCPAHDRFVAVGEPRMLR